MVCSHHSHRYGLLREAHHEAGQVLGGTAEVLNAHVLIGTVRAVGVIADTGRDPGWPRVPNRSTGRATTSILAAAAVMAGTRRVTGQPSSGTSKTAIASLFQS